ncbi:response regulator transcription factor [Microbacterium sediminicola]|uniref:Response regulator transcription factor n=1 Tax=Microbacterium sediminicola TaxID=415210 RepID=A0ABN2HSP3_9MICO
MIRIVIADDQSLIRSAVRALLEAQPDFEIVADVDDGAAAVAAVQAAAVDVVVMDIRMPVLDGIAATTAICDDPALAGTRVLILTTFEEDDYLVAALRAGASGFIGKGSEPDEIVRAVRVTHSGDALLSPTATRSLIGRYLDASPPPGRTRADRSLLTQLTPREAEVLALVATGRSNDEIAADLWISPATAKTHVNRIMTKLGARDRAQLVVWSYEAGIVVPGHHR